MRVMLNRSYYLLYGVVLLGLTSLVVILELIDLPLKNAIIKEGGIVESLSAIGYFVCIILLVCQGWKKEERQSYWYTNLLLLILGLREFDFHCRFTTMGITKTKFYVSPDVPVMEKIIGAGVTFLFLYLIIYLIKKHFKDMLSAIKQMEPYAIGICFGILFMCLSKTLDALGSNLASIGVIIGYELELIAISVEEILELGIPLMFIIAIMTRFRKS